jgi:hypothetical protein
VSSFGRHWAKFIREPDEMKQKMGHVTICRKISRTSQAMRQTRMHGRTHMLIWSAFRTIAIHRKLRPTITRAAAKQTYLDNTARPKTTSKGLSLAMIHKIELSGRFPDAQAKLRPDTSITTTDIMADKRNSQ